MRKITLFSLFSTFVLLSFGQNIELQDKNGTSIDGMQYTIKGDLNSLSETKFNVKNTSSTSMTYKVKLSEIINTDAVDMQVCFGQACYTVAAGSVNTISNGEFDLPSQSIDSELKIAPFTFAWNATSSAKWRLTVFNKSNSNDSASAVISWEQPNNITAVNIKNATKVFPNPTTDQLNIEIPSLGNDVVTFVLFNTVGDIVITENISSEFTTISMDEKNIRPGLYYYSLKDNSETYLTKRIVVK